MDPDWVELAKTGREADIESDLRTSSVSQISIDDGNETAGVPSVQPQVPLGPHLGWNDTTSGFDKGPGCGFFGGHPVRENPSRALAAQDPRPSLEERYGDHEGFVACVRAAVEWQARAGWLPPDNAARLIEEAERSDVLR